MGFSNILSHEGPHPNFLLKNKKNKKGYFHNLNKSIWVVIKNMHKNIKFSFTEKDNL